VIRSATVSGSTWRFGLRTGIFWWSGEEVSSGDLKKFFDANIERVVKDQSAGLWKIPSYKISTGKDFIQISWSKSPVFGPYIFNGVPLWREDTSRELGFQCVGLYEPRKSKTGLTFIPTPGYKRQRPRFDLHDRPQKESAIRFATAAQAGGSPWARKSNEPADCHNRLSTNRFTAIAWNLKSGITKDPEVRKVLTMLTPRGALVRSGAGYLGQITSAPIPRDHPGYNVSQKVRPFDSGDATAKLEALGYKRLNADGPRKLPGGGNVSLKILTTARSSGLAEKVVADAFSAVGIKVVFTRNSDQKDLNGALVGLQVDWPRVDLMNNYHSKVDGTHLIHPLNDGELDKLLESYSLSLTTETPNFSELQKIHAKLVKYEPVTIFMQNKLCMNVDNNLRRRLKTVRVTDPDWFKRFAM
jgi:hypothetical protein